MTDTITVGQELEGQILDTVRKSQGMAFEAIKVLADAIQPVTTAIPAVTPPLAYDFAEKLMATQRTFAEDLLHLTARFIPAPAKKG
jgi:hypothetical protein